nr:MAG TPA: nucleoside triphosphate pyrophosphohydrolase [Caudoviricetes sp.]
MDREVFRKKMLEKDSAASKIEVKNVIDHIVKNETEEINCIICMEEMAELQQEISKQFRDKGDMLGLLEELADVYICLEMLKKMFYYTDDEIAKAVGIKLERYERRSKKHE